jgi:hypothetical protein
MRILNLLCLTILVATLASSGPPVKYSQIRVFIPNKEALDKVWDAGVDFEGSSGKVGGWMEFVAGPYELEALGARKIAYTVVVEDAAARAVQELSREPMNALGFGYGSMGGYYTYAEVVQQLDSMKLLYPTLITARSSIGYTIGGRELWTVKISDNPDVDDAEPEVLYTALHHAREPGGMMTVMYYMWWLLEHYGTDPRATYLINNRQLWFVPVVNPDGYVYNQTTNPAGGGFWRKNRRANGDGSFGIDLNRNYGTYTMWNAPNGGSSTSTGSDTYRGTAPFSEPETQAIDGFMRAHMIRTALNFHTYGRYLIYPWGYLSGESADSATFREFGFDMVATNRHTTGTDLQTVNYSTRGNSDDYMYGDVSKFQTYAMTPEASSSFWPASNLILPVAMENFDMNMYCAYVAGQYTMLKSFTVADSTADGNLEPGEAFTLNAVIRNKGLGDAAGLQVSLSADDPAVSFSPPASSIAFLGARSEQALPCAGRVSPAASQGSLVHVYIDISDSAGYAHRDTLRLYLGTPTILLADGAEGGTANWTTGTGWGTSATAHAGAASFTDSPSGSYPLNANNALQLVHPLNFTGCDHAALRFWTKWTIEPTWDFAQVELSTNGGSSWISLRAPLSHAGSAYGSQAAGTWGFDGYTPGLDWVFQEIDLTPYVGTQALLRFRVTSDGADVRDGIYLDEISVVGYRPTEQRGTLTVSDNGAGSASLTFGESLLATDGLDTLLGEAGLPPAPAPGTFDARWQIAATDGSLADIRETLGPGHTANAFTAALQAGPGGLPFTLRWKSGLLQPGRWHVRDKETAGSKFDVSMWLDSTLSIPDSSVHAVEIVHTPTDSFRTAVQGGWQLVSLPMDVEDASVASLFPGALTNAWSFWTTGYVAADPLERRKGYWIKNGAPDTLSLAGVPVVRDTISVPAGWALVPASAVMCPQDAAALDCPDCSPFYIYNGGYGIMTTGRPGAGAFVRGPRTIIYSCFAPNSPAPKPSTLAALAGRSSLAIGDASGGATTLYFGPAGSAGGALARYDLPPLPPQGLFDARFSSQRLVEELPADGEGREILLQAPRYPVSVAWSALDGTYELEPRVNGVPAGRQTLRGEGRLSVSDPRITSLVLRAAGREALPASFALSQNYPNPFNPSTTVSYDVAERARVTVRVTNALGETVSTIVDHADLPAGRYRAVFDGAALSSGVYFVAMSAVPLEGAGAFQFVQKMLLIK